MSGRNNKRTKKKPNTARRLVIAVTLLIAAAVLVFAAFYQGLTVRRYTVETDKLDVPLRAVVISDLHNCIYGENQSELIAKIDEQKPDVILLTGDIADTELPDDGTLMMLDGISNKYPCFYVTGNHEIWGSDFIVKTMFREYGVVVLDGNTETVTLNGQTLNISGIDDPVVGRVRYNEQLNQVFDEFDSGVFTLFLAHRPERIDDYPEDCLIVSGHAHGGQWRIPFLVNGIYAPNQGYWPKYAGGLYEVGNRTMIVSRGLAKDNVGRAAGIPRIFNPPEIVVIDIVPR